MQKILPLFLGLPLATKFKLIQIFYSSEKRGLWLCLMTCSSEMLQNLPYFWFWNTKTRIVFFESRHRPGNSLGKKNKVHSTKSKREKKLQWVFVFQ